MRFFFCIYWLSMIGGDRDRFKKKTKRREEGERGGCNGEGQKKKKERIC